MTDELAEIQKEAALIRASDWLNRKVMWNGRKASRSQRMAWPRSGVVTQDGEIAPDEIPAEVVEACCELAGFFVEQDYLAPLDRGGDIASLSVDVISTPTTARPRRKQYSSLSPAAPGSVRLHGQGRGIMEVEEDERRTYRLAAKTARDMIRKFGGPSPCSCRRTRAFDPCGFRDLRHPAGTPGKGLLTGYKDNLVDGTVIQRGDRRLP